MHLFVYGTLLSSIPGSMAKFLRRRAELLGEATASGTLYDLGMYPGFQTGGGRVRGELYRLEPDKARSTLEMLDAYEGVTGERQDEYARRKITCRLSSGKTVDADTYVSLNIPSTAKPISDGNYGKFYRSNVEHQRFVNGA